MFTWSKSNETNSAKPEGDSTQSSSSIFWPWGGGTDEKAKAPPLSIPWRHMLGWTNSWKSITKQIECSIKLLNESDTHKLSQLCNGHQWMDNINSSEKQKYSSLYDDYKQKFVQKSDFINTKEYLKIQKDVTRTFGLFCKNSQFASFAFGLKRASYLKSLNLILNAASVSIAYCQGMNFIAAIFLLNCSEKDSFILFSFLMNERNLKVLFNPKSSCLVDYIKLFEKRLKLNYRKVYDHFKAINFSAFCYTIEWFTTCFIVSNPNELSACVIDMLLIDINDTLIRIGLSIIANLETKLLSSDLENIQISFKQLVGNLEVVDVISVALCLEFKGEYNLLGKMYCKESDMKVIPWSRSSLESNWCADYVFFDTKDTNNPINYDVTKQTDHPYDADIESELKTNFETYNNLNNLNNLKTNKYLTEIHNKAKYQIINLDKLRVPKFDNIFKSRKVYRKECCLIGQNVTISDPKNPLGNNYDLYIPCRHHRIHSSKDNTDATGDEYFTGCRILKFQKKTDGYSKLAKVYCSQPESFVNITLKPDDQRDRIIAHSWIPVIFTDWFTCSPTNNTNNNSNSREHIVKNYRNKDNCYSSQSNNINPQNVSKMYKFQSSKLIRNNTEQQQNSNSVNLSSSELKIILEQHGINEFNRKDKKLSKMRDFYKTQIVFCK